jgi:glycosyltransferase involved in cell wall biosynthesis
MKVSIVIPAYNEEKDIGACLESLEGQTMKDFEAIVVDDGSKDNTLKIVKSFKNVKVIMGEHRGPGASRNLGSRAAKGEILVFVDSDMTFDKDYIKNLIKPIVEDKSGKVIGSTHDYELVKNISNIWSRCWGKIRVDKQQAKTIKIFRAIRKDKFEEFGGFDPKYGYADDQTFWFKYKVSPAVADNTTCYHKNPENLNAVYKQSRWIGASIENYFINNKITRYLVPPLLVLLFPISVPILTLKKAIKNNDLKIILPILIFMLVRYFGTISGLYRRIYQNTNIR